MLEGRVCSGKPAPLEAPASPESDPPHLDGVKKRGPKKVGNEKERNATRPIIP